MAGDENARGDSGGQPRSLKLRIAKKAYVFDVRKKYAATRSFAVKKKAETPAEGIRESIAAALSGRKPMGDAKGQGPPAQAGAAGAAAAPKKPPSAAASAIAVAAGIFLLFALAIMFIVLQYGGAPGGPPAAAASSFMGAYSLSIGQSMVLSAGQTDKPSRTAYFLLEFGSQNVSGANFSAQLFRERPITQVFVLDHARESADTFPSFRASLASRLSRLGISLDEIGAESLSSLPEGALLIVPTGYLPIELLGNGSSGYRGLLSRGVDIVYIGMPFDTLALDATGSTVRVSNSDVSFIKEKPESKGGFMLYDAQYVAAPGKTGSSAGLAPQAALYGSVSSLRLGNGTFLLVPQFLDGGWMTDSDSQGFEKAAGDISRLIYEEAWLAPIANASATLSPPSGRDRVSLYTSQFSGDSAYAKVSVEASDANGARSRSFTVLQLAKTQKGEMTPRDLQAVPFYLSGIKTRLNLALKESDPAPVKLFVAMYKDGMELQRSEFELGLTNPTIEKSVDFQVNAEPGNYVLEIVDSAGRIYAATMLDVAGLDVSLSSADWPGGDFSFSLSSAGKPISPSSLSVALDGACEQAYSQSSLARGGLSSSLSYSCPSAIQAGMHTFTFTAGTFSKDFMAEYYARKNMWDNPLVVGLAIVSIIIFGAGTLLRRPEVLRYGLDIPDFPPLSTIKIPIKRETVLEIFDNVNAGYSWKWMPLRADEIKGGFRKLTYNGKPILIGDFNLERVLAKLREEGAVKDELDYWGKASWEKESGHSIRYLMIYRVLRNVFVNNAVKFSKLDAMPECDVKAVAGSEEIHFHIMEEPRERVAHRALATVTKGHTIIVFKTSEEVEGFRRALNSPSKLAVALKMEVNSRNILLLPVKEAVNAYLKGIAG